MPQGSVTTRKPLYVRVRVESILSEYQLAALLWDALTGEEDDESLAPVEIHSIPRARVRRLVRDRLAARGYASVDCGPTNEGGYTEAMERACVAVVRKVFGEGV
jgi:hypothetical protein